MKMQDALLICIFEPEISILSVHLFPSRPFQYQLLHYNNEKITEENLFSLSMQI